MNTPDYVIENEAKNLLAQVGVPSSNLGYDYAAKAIVLVVKDRNLIHEITYGLYPAVAKAVGATRTSVERAIRRAIETAWTVGDAEEQYRIFKNSVSSEKCKPTNGSFVARMADVLEFRIKDMEYAQMAKRQWESKHFINVSDENWEEFTELWALYCAKKSEESRAVSA